MKSFRSDPISHMMNINSSKYYVAVLLVRYRITVRMWIVVIYNLLARYIQRQSQPSFEALQLAIDEENITLNKSPSRGATECRLPVTFHTRRIIPIPWP